MNVINTTNLTKIYGDTVAIRDLNLNVPVGSIYGFLGENGAGKSTTLKILSGLQYATSGSVEIFGLNITKNRIAIAKRIGVLIETPGFIPYLTGRKILNQFARLKGIKSQDHTDELLATVNIEYAADKKVGTYSTGMKQRLGLAQALLNDPELLLLDEPFSGLDVKGVLEIKSLLSNINSKLNTSILLSSHRLREIEKLCTDAVVIRKGRVVTQGKIDELIPKRSKINMEVSDPDKASQILSEVAIPHEITDGNWLSVEINGYDRKSIVNALNLQDVSVFYLSSEDSITLEDFYLQYNKEEVAA